MEWGCITVPAGLDRYEFTELVTCELDALRQRHCTQGQQTRWKVGVEDYMRRWVGPRRNIFALAEANIATSLACFQLFGVAPLSVHPSTARTDIGLASAVATAASTGPRAPKAGASAIKQRVLSFVSQRMPAGYEWPKGGQSSRAAIYDVADAYVIAAYTALAHRRASALAEQAEAVKTADAAYLVTKRYLTHTERAKGRGGAAAVREYQDSVRKRIRQKFYRDEDERFHVDALRASKNTSGAVGA